MLLERCPVLTSCILAKLGTNAIRQKIEKEANCVGCGCHCPKSSLHVTATIATKQRGLKGHSHVRSGCRHDPNVGKACKAYCQAVSLIPDVPFNRIEGTAISSMFLQVTATCDMGRRIAHSSPSRCLRKYVSEQRMVCSETSQQLQWPFCKSGHTIQGRCHRPEAPRQDKSETACIARRCTNCSLRSTYIKWE